LLGGELALLNLRLGWKPGQDGIEFGIWGPNVFGETNISHVIPIEGLGVDLFSMGSRQTTSVCARFNY
jgi:hypothetical protein